MIYSVPLRYQSACLESGTFPPELKPAVEYFEQMFERPEIDSRNLIITGPVGCGKTWLVHAFHNYALKKYRRYAKKMVSIPAEWKDGKRVSRSYMKWVDNPEPEPGFDKSSYYTLKEIIDNVRISWETKEQSPVLYDCLKIPLLIIDEVGRTYGTQSERVELFDLFDTRWENKLPTVCISNFPRTNEKNPEDSLEYKLGQGIIDRLYDNAIVIEMKTTSRRNSK